jgi:hypothetical protein
MKKNIYKVQLFMDNIYEVYSLDNNHFISHYQGNLADCEAWIRLKEEGRI